MRNAIGLIVGVMFFAAASLAACTGDDGGGGPYCGDGTCSNGENHTSCPSDCPASGPYCGDGTCNNGETTSSCPADCGAACDPTDPNSCSGETICARTSCQPAFPRAYTITIFSATIPQFKPDGTTWDAAGGAPDPFAEVYLNNQLLGTTSTASDTFTPNWGESTAPTTIVAGSNLQIDLYDEDVASNDYIFSCSLTPLTADNLRQGYIDCTGAAGDLTFFFGWS